MASSKELLRDLEELKQDLADLRINMEETWELQEELKTRFESQAVVLQRLEATCDRLLDRSAQESDRPEEASAAVSQVQLAEVLAKLERLERQVNRPDAKELGSPGLRTKAETRPTNYDISPAKALIAVVEVPEQRKGNERLDLSVHVRPREYPGQCPRFPAAQELIQQLYDYQVGSGRQRFWSDFPKDPFFVGRVFGPQNKFLVYRTDCCFACGSQAHSYKNCGVFKKNPALRFCHRCGCPGVADMRRCLFYPLPGHEDNSSSEKRPKGD